ncbi:mechanosensitive ion channel family protein [Paenibacillus agricola]|uniref:Mechanosensitive ion channel family protein n=1 Tax=Paenibacillus agricola TaxID=2716264 RepID=A0ABX0JEY8_9BACL|nr:mechanosensitive ion channel family protein [Paenibacillus agricola]NHN32265.1 mechanosensitive ion channel family protein [Paenibacillus agricola]
MKHWQSVLVAETSAAEVINSWEKLSNELIRYIVNPAVWMGFIFIIIKVVFILIAAKLIVKVANKTLEHMMIERARNPLNLDRRRTKTIGKLLGNITSYVVNFIMILMILNQFGIRLEPLLAGAGVVGLAIGFGAQSLVKDVITGFFIIFEDQFAVGDVIQSGVYKGTVEEIGLRVTIIRTLTGEVHIIPNGTILQVTNFSVHNSIAIMDIAVPNDMNIDDALKILHETVMKNYENNVNMVKEPEVLGVQALGATEMTIRASVECKPNTQVQITRAINAEVKKALDKFRLEMASSRGE